MHNEDTDFLGLKPPTNLRVKSRDERSLRLQWDAAPGDFENYAVSCEGGEGYNCSRSLIRVGRNEGEEVMITGLAPGALYQFSVEALHTQQRSGRDELSTRTCE